MPFLIAAVRAAERFILLPEVSRFGGHGRHRPLGGADGAHGRGVMLLAAWLERLAGVVAEVG